MWSYKVVFLSAFVGCFLPPNHSLCPAVLLHPFLSLCGWEGGGRREGRGRREGGGRREEGGRKGGDQGYKEEWRGEGKKRGKRSVKKREGVML